jgi:hypothetical protein
MGLQLLHLALGLVQSAYGRSGRDGRSWTWVAPGGGSVIAVHCVHCVGNIGFSVDSPGARFHHVP